MCTIYWFFKWNKGNTEVDNAKDLDEVMLLYNLLECSNNYSNKIGNLWQYCEDEPINNRADSESFKSESKFADHTNCNSCNATCQSWNYIKLKIKIKLN